MRARLSAMSVRAKLLLFSAGPVLVTGAFLLFLFSWAQSTQTRSYEDALAWQRHVRALQNLDWTARFYVDTVADGIAQDPVPHMVESKRALESARAEARSLASRFSAEEQAAHARLDADLSAFTAEGRRVGRDRARLRALVVTYRSIDDAIDRRVAEEEDGSARALRKTEEVSEAVRIGGISLALLVLLTAIGAAMTAIRSFAGRIASLEQAAARVAAGNLEGDVPVTSGDELGGLAASLKTMVEALRLQRTRQLGFLAGVSHDLRNPLGAMRLTTEGLLQPAELPPAPVVRKSLTLIERQIDRLARPGRRSVRRGEPGGGEARARAQGVRPRRRGA